MSIDKISTPDNKKDGGYVWLSTVHVADIVATMVVIFVFYFSSRDMCMCKLSNDMVSQLAHLLRVCIG